MIVIRRDSLDLSGRELTHTRGLAQTFVAVMTLNLSKNSISIIGALPVGLRVLDISCNILLDLQGCSALKRLEKMDVSHNRIQSFAGIEGCLSLKNLYAQSNPLQIVTHIDMCPHLQLVDLSDCSISSWDGVRVLSLCKSLRQLALKGCPVFSPSIPSACCSFGAAFDHIGWCSNAQQCRKSSSSFTKARQSSRASCFSKKCC